MSPFLMGKLTNFHPDCHGEASISANRISFCLGLEGVSVTVDTACSSTLVALDLALQRLGRLEAVLCSGGQLNLIVDSWRKAPGERLKIAIQ